MRWPKCGRRGDTKRGAPDSRSVGEAHIADANHSGSPPLMEGPSGGFGGGGRAGALEPQI